MENQIDLITVGESIIELSSDKDFKDATCFDKFYGGDAIVTAITAARFGVKTGYITCVGDDPFKDFLLNEWKKENLNTDFVRTVPEQNAIALISRHDGKPKELALYRKKTAAQKLSLDDTKADYIKSAKYFYTTGITQSLSLSAREAVKKSYEIAKENHIITAYDPNYKKTVTTPEAARECFEDVISNIDILFLSGTNDIPVFFEAKSIDNVVKYCWDLGIQIVVVKSTENSGYYTGCNGEIVFNEYFAKTIVDTTCSGDAFNGAFLSALIKGKTPNEATKLGTIVSGLQAQKIGAIKSIPTLEEVKEITHKVE